MNRFLHLMASPRGTASRTLGLASVFVERVKQLHPQAVIEEVDLFAEKLPDLFADTVKGKYVLMGGADIPAEMKPAWREVEFQINRFMASDTILISTPMWNFGVPYQLKHYIDVIFQPRYLYKFTPEGPVGLAAGKKVYFITTRGGDYSPGSPRAHYDLLEPYLRHIFGFIGVSDMKFIHSQPMDAGGPEVMHKKFEETAAIIRTMDI